MHSKPIVLPCRKPRRSVLDSFAKTLLKMAAKRVPVPEIHQWLERRKIDVNFRTISRYLEKLRNECFEREYLSEIGITAKQCKKLEAAFRKNPPPGLKILIKSIQVLIWKINVSKESSTAQIALANRLLNTVMRFSGHKVGKQFKERQVRLAEQNSREVMKAEQARGLQFCLTESKKFPQVQALFRKAFAALREAKATRYSDTKANQSKSQ